MSPIPLNVLPADDSLSSSSGQETFHHAAPRPHLLVHPREKKAQARASAGLNEKIALGITRLSSSMWTVYVIVAFIAGWILLNTSVLRFDPLPWALLLTLVNLPQLPMQFVLMVGQAVLDKKQETLSVTQFEHTEDILHDMAEVMTHLARQDRELLQQSRDIRTVLSHIELLSGTPIGESEDGSKHLVRAHLRASSGHAKKGTRESTPPPASASL